MFTHLNVDSTLWFPLSSSIECAQFLPVFGCNLNVLNKHLYNYLDICPYNSSRVCNFIGRKISPV